MAGVKIKIEFDSDDDDDEQFSAFHDLRGGAQLHSFASGEDDRTACPLFSNRRVPGADISLLHSDNTYDTGLQCPQSPSLINGDDPVNSDEERSRLKRRCEFNKATAMKAKRARRNQCPSEEWKATVNASAPENVQLRDDDLIRRDMPIRFIDRAAEMNVHVAEDGTVSVPDILPMPVSVGKKKQRPHLMYPPSTPISIQRSHIPRSIALDKQTADRVAMIEAQQGAPDTAPTPLVYDGMPVTQVRASAIHLARNLKKEDYARGIVVPESANIYTLGMENVMENRLPPEYSQIAAQSVLQDPRCQREEFNFITNALRQTHLYNWPSDGLHLTESYYAHMTPISFSNGERMCREPRKDERPCVEGMNCAGRQIPRCEPITLVEYFTEDDMATFRRTGKWTKPRGHCFMCKIKNASECAPRIMAECAAYTNQMVKERMTTASIASDTKKVLMLVDFYCRVGEGEFSPYDVFFSGMRFTGIASPVPAFVRDRFKQKQHPNGMRYYVMDYDRPERNLDVWEAEVSEALSRTRQLRQAYEVNEQTVISFEPRPRC